MPSFEAFSADKKEKSGESFIEGPKKVPQELIDQLIAEGKTPEEAERIAVQRFRQAVKRETQ